MSGVTATAKLDLGRHAAPEARARIIEALLQTMCERGFTCTTIGEVCARARVSRNTFYQCFSSLRDCFAAVMDDAHRRASELIAQSFAGRECWREGIRTALGTLLDMLDHEPLLARALFVESLAAGGWALERRDRSARLLTAQILERWPPPLDSWMDPLIAGAVMESVLGVIRTRVLAADGEPLLGLLGPLMGLIAAVYNGAESAAEEHDRGQTHASLLLCARAESSDRSAESVLAPAIVGAPAAEVMPESLLDPRAHRARACMLFVARHPGASNRQVASAIGIAGAAQASRLLTRMAAEGLLQKRAGAPGAPNAWSVTSLGVRVAAALARSAPANVRTRHRYAAVSPVNS